MKKPDCCSIDRSRRHLLKSAGGLGALSLLELFGAAQAKPVARRRTSACSARDRGGPRQTRDLPPHARRDLARRHVRLQAHTRTHARQDLPASVRETQRLSTMSGGQSAFPIVGPLRPFKQRGESGAWVSEFLPYTGAIADELCFVKSLHTEHVNHDPASKFLHTGFQLAGRPSAGAWVSYALGSDNRDLPNFVVMNSGVSQGVPQDAAIWGPGFLPSHHQGVEFRAADDPVLYVNNPAGIDSSDRRAMLDSLAKLATLQHAESNDPDILSRVSQYEMAYRMQSSVPEVADISDEPEAVLAMYGPDVQKPGTFARNCLVARRLAERGVKYQTLFHLGWDLHLAIKQNSPALRRDRSTSRSAGHGSQAARPARRHARHVRQEFGRTPFAQGQIDNPLVGRDHHGGCFTWWFAGGGVKAGYTHGETDEFSYNIVKTVHIHDLNATLLHVLGLDHERLTFRFQGRDYRLTDVMARSCARSWRNNGHRHARARFFLGRFHVLALHLPIGIVIAAVVLDWLARRPRYAALAALRRCSGASLRCRPYSRPCSAICISVKAASRAVGGSAGCGHRYRSRRGRRLVARVTQRRARGAVRLAAGIAMLVLVSITATTAATYARHDVSAASTRRRSFAR